MAIAEEEALLRRMPEMAGYGRTFLLLRTDGFGGKFRRICMPKSILSLLERLKMRDARRQKLHLLGVPGVKTCDQERFCSDLGLNQAASTTIVFQLHVRPDRGGAAAGFRNPLSRNSQNSPRSIVDRQDKGTGNPAQEREPAL
jgi:hypothetical protein